MGNVGAKRLSSFPSTHTVFSSLQKYVFFKSTESYYYSAPGFTSSFKVHLTFDFSHKRTYLAPDS
jgi:hypothetical protein